MVAYPPVLPVDVINWTDRHTDTYPEIDPATKSNHSGKAVFITEASHGIGLATAISYAVAGVSHLGLGARGDMNRALNAIAAKLKELDKPMPKILTIHLDVSKEDSVNAAAKKVEIFSTSSVGAYIVMYGAPSYQTGKLALLRYGEFLMHEYGEPGILMYSIHHGSIKTDMADNMTDEFKTFLTDTAELSADSLVFLIQVKRDWLAGRYVDRTWDMPKVLSREKEIVEVDKLKVRLVM